MHLPTTRSRRLLVVLLVGCVSAAAAPQSKRADPAAAFSALEQRLLQARTVRMTFHVTASGVVEADVRGLLAITSDRHVRLTGSGQFAGQPIDVALQAEDDTYEFGHRTRLTTARRPAALEEALLIGLTRMGVLHNLARLVGATPPDHAEGGVGAWVVVDAFTSAPPATSFELSVAGERAGFASLAIDRNGRPTVRRQTVRFPEGEMQVVEAYADVTIEP